MESVSIGVDLLNRLRVGEASAVAEFVALYKEQVCRQARITLRHSVRGQLRDEDAFQTVVESMFNSALHRILSNIREGQLDCDLRPVAYMSRMIQH